MTWHPKYLVFGLLLVFLTGCSAEKKLARIFVENGIKDEFLLMKPGYVFKYNLKTYEFPGIDTLDETTRDSILLTNSLFLKDMEDRKLIDAFSDQFLKTFKAYGIKVYPENYLDTLLNSGKRAIVINIAQMSVEEYVHPYTSDAAIDDDIYEIKDIDLNALNLNVWLEISSLNFESKQTVLFTSDYLLDKLSGTFKQYLFFGDIKFEYTIDTLSVPEFYQFASDFGKSTAEYFYDYYMNKYIDENLPESYPFDRYYYHYDPEHHSIYAIDPANALVEIKK